MTFSGEFLAFILLALVSVIGGVLLINLTKVMHMIVALVFTFLGIAGIYVLLSAEFVAFTQVMVYAGAITIIMLFGIMLTKHNDEENESHVSNWRKSFVFLGVLGFAFAVYIGIYNFDIPQVQTQLHVDNALQIGKALYTKHVIPFEVTSVLLLVALVGSIILAKKEEKEADSK